MLEFVVSVVVASDHVVGVGWVIVLASMSLLLDVVLNLMISYQLRYSIVLLFPLRFAIPINVIVTIGFLTVNLFNVAIFFGCISIHR